MGNSASEETGSFDREGETYTSPTSTHIWPDGMVFINPNDGNKNTYVYSSDGVTIIRPPEEQQDQ